MSSIDTLIANSIRPDVRAIAGYHVADASGFIKLDAMENPYHLPEHLRHELGQRLADVTLNRYPVASYATLKQRICATLGVPAGYDVILGNGSDELISILTWPALCRTAAPSSWRRRRPSSCTSARPNSPAWTSSACRSRTT